MHERIETFLKSLIGAERILLKVSCAFRQLSSQSIHWSWVHDTLAAVLVELQTLTWLAGRPRQRPSTESAPSTMNAISRVEARDLLYYPNSC